MHERARYCEQAKGRHTMRGVTDVADWLAVTQRYQMPHRSGDVVAQVATVALVVLLVPLLAGCGSLAGQTIVQGGGLPSLHRLDWGARYVERTTWSPNGKWIAALVGSSGSGEYLEVLTPSGRLVQNLTSWQCGPKDVSTDYTFAWRPDNSLSCINQQEVLIGAYPFTSVQRFPMHPALLTPRDGGGWSPDGQTAVLVSDAPPTNGTRYIGPGQLYALSAAGLVTLQALTPSSEDLSNPAWQPQHRAVSVMVRARSDALGYYNLLLSTVQPTRVGGLVVGPPQTLASDVDLYYAWSPSGNWVAVRHSSYTGGDKMYLVNAANPSQTVDVVVAAQVGQQMMAPIWSPDGQQLIVFSVAYGASQPYTLDIGAYLHSKGLQP